MAWIGTYQELRGALDSIGADTDPGGYPLIHNGVIEGLAGPHEIVAGDDLEYSIRGERFPLVRMLHRLGVGAELEE